MSQTWGKPRQRCLGTAQCALSERGLELWAFAYAHRKLRPLSRMLSAPFNWGLLHLFAGMHLPRSDSDDDMAVLGLLRVHICA
jgi:hypothetical protein